ncbi:MAG: DUF2335 domain-containing protein [Desulfomonilaceae bacterium]|nr:DUF2335 domain-containing protein [Desulfomonilaceae bacterium]
MSDTKDHAAGVELGDDTIGSRNPETVSKADESRQSDVGEAVPEAVRRRIQAISALFSGPLPPPAVLEKYNQAVENGAERVFKQFEITSEHTRQMDWYLVRAGVRESVLGQIFGFAIGLAAMTASCYAISQGAETAASVIGGTTVIGLVTVFVLGRKSSRKDDERPQSDQRLSNDTE